MWAEIKAYLTLSILNPTATTRSIGLPPLAALWFLAGMGAAWPADSERVEDHLAELTEHLGATLLASYRYEGQPLEWALKQSFQAGGTRCSGETLLHEVVQRPSPGADRFWDRYTRWRFDLSDVRMIVVKPGVRPLIYTLPGEPAKLEPGLAAFTVTITTSGKDFQIEFHGFDGGEAVPADAPLHFMSYYHDLFVPLHSNAIGAAAYLRTLAEACGSGPVKMYDLGS
jgi:hypothetical protein